MPKKTTTELEDLQGDLADVCRDALADMRSTGEWNAGVINAARQLLKEKGTITLSATEGGYFPFEVKIYGRLSNESYQISQFETATALETAGAQVHYNTSTRVLSIEFQENAVRAWEDGSGVLAIPWSSLDDVRIVIT